MTRPADPRHRRLSPASLPPHPARPARHLGAGRQPAAGLRRRRAGRAVRAEPDQPRLRAGPGARPLDAALAGRAGVRPVLLDWGWPGAAERRFTLTDYVAGRLAAAVAAVPGPVVLAGYCMGGLLALAAALRQPERLRGLALLATPWDFHAAGPPPCPGDLRGAGAAAGRWHAAGRRAAGAVHAAGCRRRRGQVSALRPTRPGERAGAHVRGAGGLACRTGSRSPPRWRGVPRRLVRREHAGDRAVAGRRRGRGPGGAAPAHPGRPAGAGPHRPAARARPPCCRLIPGAAALRPRAGHVGMVAGSRAETELWQPALDWIRRL